MASGAPLGFRSRPVQRLRRLLARRDERDAAQAFLVEGVRGVEAALAAGADVEAVFVAPGARARCPRVFELAAARGVPVTALAEGVMERVADAVTPQPVMAVVGMAPVDLHELRGSTLVVVLVDVRDPGNAGTIVRSARAAGASAVVFCRGSADVYGPKVVRAAAGALFSVPVVRGGDALEVLDVLGQMGLRRLGATARGGESYDRADLARPTALVLGNEASGLGHDLEARLDGRVTIPMQAGAESLNVAMAATVLVFEAQRQRGLHTVPGTKAMR